MRAREQGHLSPGVGTPIADTDKQDPLTQDQGGLDQLEANGGTLEALQCTETVLTAGREVPAPNTGQMAIQGTQILAEADPSQGLLEHNQALMVNQLSPKNEDRRPQDPNGQMEDREGHLGIIEGPPHKK